MRCPHCSAFVDKGSNRCWRCWLPIAAAGDTPSGPRVSRAERRRSLQRQQHRAWRRRLLIAGGVALAAGAIVFFVYDTIVAPDPRPDEDVAVAMLPTLGELPPDWSRGADAPNLAPPSLAECEPVLGEPLDDAIEAEASVAFQFDDGGSLVRVESFLLDGDDGELARKVVDAYGTGCVATRVAERVVSASALGNPETQALEVDGRDATVRGRRVSGSGGDDAWTVDVVAVAVDRGVTIFARASEGDVAGGIDTDGLVALVVPRIEDQLST